MPDEAAIVAWRATTEERLTRLRTDVDSNEARITAVETEVDHLQIGAAIVTSKQAWTWGIVGVLVAGALGVLGAIVGGWASAFFAR